MYIVNKNGITTRMNEDEALELLKEAARDVCLFSLVAPSEASKLRRIIELDNLQNDINIRVKPYDKDANFTLIINARGMIARAKCSVSERNIKMIKETELE